MALPAARGSKDQKVAIMEEAEREEQVKPGTDDTLEGERRGADYNVAQRALIEYGGGDGPSRH